MTCVIAPARLRTGFLLLSLKLLLSLSTAAAQVPLDPRSGLAQEQLARCAQALPQHNRGLSLSFSGLPPFAREVLTRHTVRTSITGEGRQLRVELHLDNLRSLTTPSEPSASRYLPARDGVAIMQDPRSGIAALWRLDEATVTAADRAYDIRQSAAEAVANMPAVLVDSEVADALPDYRVVRTYTDTYSGFAALVLEPRPEAHLAPHRIYAIAGTHVFAHRDFRSWASGLTLGRAQFVSTAALGLISDAADYARGQPGGEVVFTGQSQGGLTAQGLGYLLQAYLDAEPLPHKLVQVVSWGAVGAEEVILRLLKQHRNGDARGFWPDLEAHWAATDPDYAAAAMVWANLGRQWDAIPPGQELAQVRATTARLRAIGYFFEIDLFARAGTFIGTTMAFPTELILPDACDTTVVEAVIGLQGGSFGVRLESHFLQGYRRAVARGAIAVARPALPVKWGWVGYAAPALEPLGLLWLDTLYLEQVASGPANWQRCLAATRWQTAGNRSCRVAYWPNCAPDEEERQWCLIREGGTVAPILR
jgi:hypothetical protein